MVNASSLRRTKWQRGDFKEWANLYESFGGDCSSFKELWRKWLVVLFLSEGRSMEYINSIIGDENEHLIG
jgi:hypothetical protein